MAIKTDKEMTTKDLFEAMVKGDLEKETAQFYVKIGEVTQERLDRVALLASTELAKKIYTALRMQNHTALNKLTEESPEMASEIIALLSV